MSRTAPLAPLPTASELAQIQSKGLMPSERLLVVFILDRSGLMNDIKSDTLGAYNKYVRDLQDHRFADQVRFSCIQFSKKVTKDRISRMRNVRPLTEQTYICDGSTALFDAIGITVKDLERVAKEKPHYKILIIILTDGHENASETWYRYSLFDLIAQKQALGWQFLFLGATQESMHDAHATGLGGSSVSWDATKTGVHDAFRTVTDTTSELLDPEDLERIRQAIEEQKRKSGQST